MHVRDDPRCLFIDLCAESFEVPPQGSGPGVVSGSRSAAGRSLGLNADLPDAFELMERWNFKYITTLTWIKPTFGLGSYFRTSTEHVLFGVRGRLLTRVRNLERLCSKAEARLDCMGKWDCGGCLGRGQLTIMVIRKSNFLCCYPRFGRSPAGSERPIEH